LWTRAICIVLPGSYLPSLHCLQSLRPDVVGRMIQPASTSCSIVTENPEHF